MHSLYIALGILQFGEGLISIFVPLYFWGLHFSIAKILFFYLLSSLYFLILVLITLPLMRRLSDKMMMFVSAPFIVCYFLGLGFVDDIPFLFYILPLFISFAGLFFNVGYHIDFAGSADDGYVGREVGLRFMTASLMKFSAPFLGGVLITVLGFKETFFIAALLILFAIVPLMFFPARTIASHLTLRSIKNYLFHKKLIPFTLSGIGYAIEFEVAQIIWPIFIFITIGSLEGFGAIISAGLFVGAGATFLTGFLADVGRRRKVLSYMTVGYSLILGMRMVISKVLPIVLNHVVGAIMYSSLMVAWSSQYYKIARVISDPSSFILSREVLYHLTRVAFLPVVMLFSLVVSRGSFFITLFAIAGIANFMFLLSNKLHTRDITESALVPH